MGAVELQNVEYLEYAVRDLAPAETLFERLGFVRAGVRTGSSRRSVLYVQGDIRAILVSSSSERDPAFQFTRIHGDGIMNVAYGVAHAEDAFRRTVQMGARQAHGPEALQGRGGQELHRAAIHVFGDVRNTFISYKGRARLEDFFTEDAEVIGTGAGRFLQTVDHITVNLEKGQLERWAAFYREFFGFHEVRYFDIRTDKTGLISRAMRSPNGRVTMPFNEPTNGKSQIQEFVDNFHGPGIQHMAFHTSNIGLCLTEMRAQRFEFLSVPATYYEAARKRLPHVSEDWAELAKLDVLVDGGEKGYLLQIFTQPVMGPLFFEFIQRKGDNGFGDGNFRALFEAIERDQIRRGYLS